MSIRIFCEPVLMLCVVMLWSRLFLSVGRQKQQKLHTALFHYIRASCIRKLPTFFPNNFNGQRLFFIQLPFVNNPIRLQVIKRMPPKRAVKASVGDKDKAKKENVTAESDEPSQEKAISSKSRARGKTAKAAIISEEDVPAEPVKRSRKKAASSEAKTVTAKKTKTATREEIVAEPSQEEEVGRKPRVIRRQRARPAIREESPADEPVKPSRKKAPASKPKTAAKKAKTPESDDENDAAPVPKKVSRKRAPTSKTAKEKKAKTTDAEEHQDEAEAKKPKAAANKTSTDWTSINYTCSINNSEDRPHNLIISSWNVGGLKSWVSKGCLEYLDHEKPDIFCMQETKCSEEKLPNEIKNLKLYKQYWCSSKKEGYAGVALFTIKAPIKVTYGIEEPDLDEDGRCITAEYDQFFLICVYVPNAGRKLVTLPKRLQWNKAFKEYVSLLESTKPVIICGDMNVSHNEIDLARPSSNKKNAGFTEEEREGMTDFLEGGYVDTFRELYPDKADAYTFWTYMANARAKNVGWRLDYFIASKKIMPKVCDNVMRSEIAGSDHCPITLFLNINADGPRSRSNSQC